MTSCIADVNIRHLSLPLESSYRASRNHQVRTRFSATLIEVHTDAGIAGYGSGDSIYGFDQLVCLFARRNVRWTERQSDALATLALHSARYWPLDIAIWDAQTSPQTFRCFAFGVGILIIFPLIAQRASWAILSREGNGLGLMANPHCAVAQGTRLFFEYLCARP
ncbi:hypothetical protein [Ktedonospora formicarum]|uniref:Mandelate racemase/muconate lactonizing enzyme N-terminal domain-containing protein n=1 Tax=Ktedonospora formicarum TaxID=2778364 RepID=A0A8J3HXI5_9CHLR|nr:hypothetical protein [Ktedonospora formicarum]GHO45051.1 hypothetical protein KSX_32140 [Ktedonospora formicarum]